MSATITWLGHSTVQMILPDDRVVIIDPFLDENPMCPESFKKPSRCDLLLLTHGHFDHISGVAGLIDRFNPTIIGNFELCAALEKTLGKGKYSPMNTGGTQTIDKVHVSLTPALHSSSIATDNGPMYAGMPNGFIVKIDVLASVYHAGDTDIFSEMALIARRYAPQICILCMGGYFTMDAKAAAMATDMLKPTSILPIHYKTFPVLAQSVDELRRLLPAKFKGALLAPNPGQELVWTAAGLE